MNYHSLTNAPFSVGVELPLDNDWSKAGQASRLQDGRARHEGAQEAHPTG